MSLIVELVKDNKDLKSIFRLRYKVYCYEWSFEKPEKYKDELLTDIYDSTSLHFAVKNDANKIVGALSLIMNSPQGFPAEQNC